MPSPAYPRTHRRPGIRAFNRSSADAVAGIVKGRPASVIGADANQDIDRWAAQIGPGMKAYGKQSGICLVTALPLADVALDHYGEQEGWTDHPAVAGSLP